MGKLIGSISAWERLNNDPTSLWGVPEEDVFNID
jgi:hypothetical protein